MVAHRGGVGSRQEVWQDQRTGLLWSSLAAAGTSYDWCPATGNAQSVGGVDCTANNISMCTEITGFSSAGFSETANVGPYANEKGGMGKASTPPVMWRVPTIHDYFQAYVDGLRYVMPDAGAIYRGSSYEWSSTVCSENRDEAWRLSSDNYTIGHPSRAAGNSNPIRCVGRP
jgi:hypothetical protein